MTTRQQPKTYLDAQTIAAALGGKARGNQIAAPAPGHSKHDRSLSIFIDPSAPEGFMVNPHAGEDPIAMRDYVRTKAGLPDWTPRREEHVPPTAHLKIVASTKRDPFHDADLIGRGFRLAAEYDYATPDGEVLFQVLRYEHDTQPKTFRQRQPDGKGGWLSGRPDPILYRWPEIASRPREPVFVVEGEKDADTLINAGLLATTPPNGSWPSDLSPLKGRTVFVIPDNDATGAQKADKAVSLLQGIATVKRVELPGLPEKGDVTDWLEAGNTVEHLRALAKAATPVVANQNDRFSVDWFGDIQDSMPKETFIKGTLGVGEFTMLSGKPGTGKSVIVTDMACHVAAGMEWHGRRVQQGFVVYIAAERKDLTKRRMLAFRKRHGVGAIPLAVLSGRIDLTSSLKDAEALIATVKALEAKCGQRCIWIIIDTLTRVFGPGDQNASKDMTKFIQACDAILEGVEASHVTTIHHTGWAGDRGKGAIDLDGAVDASFMVKKESGAYVLECDGTNDGDEGVITHFRMEGVQVGVDEDGEPTMAPVVVQAVGPADSLAGGLLKKIRGNAATALDILRRLTADGNPLPMALWRIECRNAFDDGSGKSADALNKQFERAKETLLAAEAVEQIDGAFLPLG